MVAVILEILGGYLITRQLEKLGDPELAAIAVPLVVGGAILLLTRKPSFLEKVYKAVK